MKKHTVWLVIPCYNEQAVLPTTATVLQKQWAHLEEQGLLTADSRILLVDDGSTDGTWDIIKELHRNNSTFCGLKLAHNRGHQNALIAGITYATGKCDCLISLDADLQDDIAVIEDFILKYNDGCEVVYGVRKARKTDTVFKRTTARAFYKGMRVAGAEIVYDHADYRLLGSKALAALRDYHEVNLFLRGIIPLLGFKTDYVYYERHERFAGESKYPLKKMAEFALDGITSFSVKPLRLIFLLGLLFVLISGAGLAYTLISHFFGFTVPGWTALSCSIWFIASVVMLSLGVIGEYIGKIYSEVKQRPRFCIEEVIDFEPESFT